MWKGDFAETAAFELETLAVLLADQITRPQNPSISVAHAYLRAAA